MLDALLTPSWWITALGRASFQAALGILGVLIVGLLAPRLSGSLRCWLWRLAFGRALLALFWSAPVPLPSLSPTPSPTVIPKAARPHVHPPSIEAFPARALPGRTPWDATLPLALGWLLGAAGCAGFGVRQFRLSRRLLQRSRSVTDPRLLEPWEELRALLSLPATLELREADGLASPLVLGRIRPVVIVPASLGEEWSRDEVRLMLAHELAHVRRHDLLWGWLPALTHTMLFFHPLVWIGSREWRLAHDSAADELALRVTGAPIGEYARLLVRLAGLRRPAAVGLALLDARDTARTLERRLKLMSSRTPLGSRRGHLPALFLGACIALPIHGTAQNRKLANDPAPTVASNEVYSSPLRSPVKGTPAPGNRLSLSPLQEREKVRQRRLREVEQQVRELKQQLDLLVRKNRDLEEARRRLDAEVRSLREAQPGRGPDQRGQPRAQGAPDRSPEIDAAERQAAERQAAEAAAARQRALNELEQAERQLQAAMARLNASRVNNSGPEPGREPGPEANVPVYELTLRLLRQDEGAERQVAVVKVAVRERQWTKVQLLSGKVIPQEGVFTRAPDSEQVLLRVVRGGGRIVLMMDWPAAGVMKSALVRPGEVMRFMATKERVRELTAPNPQVIEASISPSIL